MLILVYSLFLELIRELDFDSTMKSPEAMRGCKSHTNKPGLEGTGTNTKKHIPPSKIVHYGLNTENNKLLKQKAL
jgi:hypothetical protein